MNLHLHLNVKSSLIDYYICSTGLTSCGNARNDENKREYRQKDVITGY